MAVDGYLNFDTRINTKGFQAGQKSIVNSIDTIKSAVFKLGTAFGVTFGVNALANFSKGCVSSAREAGDALIGLQSIITGTGRDFSKAQKFLNEYVADGLVPMQNAVTAYKNLASRGYDDSQIQSVMLALKNSAMYGRQSSLTLGYAVQSATEGLKNENSILVDNAGVTKNVSVMWKDYASSIGTTYTNLTKQQKIQAEVNGILAETQFQMNDASKASNSFSGQIAMLSTNFTKFKVAIGDVLINALQPVITFLNVAVKSMTEYITTFSKMLGLKSYSQSGTENNSYSNSGLVSDASQVTDEIADSVENQNQLTDAVEETANAEERSLAGFDEINKISDNTEIEIQQETTNDNIIPSQTVEVTPVLSGSVEITANTNSFEDAMKSAVERIKSLIQPFKIAWEDNSPQLVESIRSAFENIKELIRSVAESFETVWENGSGELYISNIIILFSDLFGIIGDIAGALTTAWNDNGTGEALIQSYFDRWNALLELIHVIANDFREVWNDGTGIEICSNVFEIITNINETVANLRERFQIAWQENETGKGIIQGILDIFNTILKTINDITSDTKDWAETLDFTPLLTSIQGLLKSLEPFTENIGSGLEWFYNNVLLPLASWTIENIIPAFLALLSAVIKLLNAVITTFKPLAKWLWDNFLQPIAEWTGGIIVSVINGIADALTSVSDWITEHQTLVQDFVIIVASIGTSLAIAGIINAVVTAFTAMGGIMGILVTIELGLQTITTVLAGAFTALLSPVILIPVLIGAVIAIGILLIKHWDEVKAIACGIWESIQETLYSFFDAWVAGWNSIKKTISKFFEWVSSKISYIKEIGKNIINGLLEGITEFFDNPKQWVKDHIFTPFVNAFKNLFGIHSPSTVMAELGGYIVDGLCNEISDSISKVKEIFEKILSTIKSVFEFIGDWFGEKFQLAWDGIKNAFSGVKGFFEDVWNGITGVFSHVTNWFKDKFSNAWEAVKNVFSKGGEIFTGITDGIFDTFKTIVNGLIDGINWVISQPFDAINWALDGIRDIEIAGWYPFEWLPSIDTPQIPYLAQGTVVPANYGNFLAVLGDNKKETEVVSPLSTIEQAVANAMKNNSVGVIHVHVDLDGREIGRVAVKAVNENKLRGGA